MNLPSTAAFQAQSSHEQLRTLFDIAVKKSLPENCLPEFLESIDASNGLCVIGAGKAAAEMAAIVNKHFAGQCNGAVVTRYGYSSEQDTGDIEVLLAAHPYPDENSEIAAKDLLARVEQNPANRPILFIISGGGSSLLSLPADGITLQEKHDINRFLLASGAAIDEINTVRTHLSKVKGGKLAAAAKSPFSTLILSDVIGDDPSIIASGPTIPNHTTAADALDILARYGWQPKQTVIDVLKQQSACPSLPNADAHIIANGPISLNYSKLFAESAGVKCITLEENEQGEAQSVAKAHAQIVAELAQNSVPVMLFSGGELTVSLGDSPGDGGPNQEYLLALALALEPLVNSRQLKFTALACDTDGVDGSRDVAGAIIDHHLLTEANSKHIDAATHLSSHCSFDFFEQLNRHVITGPTRTNVNDFRVIYIQAINAV